MKTPSFVMEYCMGDEKIEQNIERVDTFLFHTLGCGKEDVKRIVKGMLKKRRIDLDIERRDDSKIEDDY